MIILSTLQKIAQNQPLTPAIVEGDTTITWQEYASAVEQCVARLSMCLPQRKRIRAAFLSELNAVRNHVKPHRFTLASIIVALVGVVIVISEGNLALLLSGQVGLGDVLVTLGALCWVTYTMGAASFKTWSPLRYTTLSTLLGTCTIIVATLIATGIGYVHTPSLPAVLGVWWQLSYLIVIAAVIAVLAWNSGIKRLGAQNGILFMNLVPVTTFIITIIGGYRFSPMELLGASMTIGALIANNLYLRSALKKPRASTNGIVALPKFDTVGGQQNK